ncbi:hypothetical protein THALO_60069 [Tenacibaculum halocynthiae]
MFDRINETWKIIDYYLEHKVIPKIKETDYSKLSPIELLNKQKND